MSDLEDNLLQDDPLKHDLMWDMSCGYNLVWDNLLSSVGRTCTVLHSRATVRSFRVSRLRDVSCRAVTKLRLTFV